MSRSSRLPIRVLAVLGAFAALGCTGSINGGGSSTSGGNGNPDNGGGNSNGGSNGSSNGGGTGGGGTVNTPPAPMGATASEAPLRRLNAQQYQNTIADLLGLGTMVTPDVLPPDEAIDDRFISNTVRPVQGVDVDRYQDVALTLATAAVKNLPGLMGCDPASGEQSCVTQFITSFGKRAYRRPLTQAEIDRANKLYAAGRMGADIANGVRLVVQGMLQSVNFLYLFEPAPANSVGKVVGLDPYSMASRLSYFFLNSMPDKELFAAADGNQLSTPEQVEAQAKRLINSPRFLDTVGNFHDQWLELGDLKSADKDPMKFPNWNDGLRAALTQETRQFVDYVLRQGDGKLDTLLSSNFALLTGPLYAHYGVPMPAGASATAWTKVDLDATQRSGLLTQAGLMAVLAHEDRTSYILRGKLVREGFLCTIVPDPPAGVDTSESKIPATADARTRAAMHRTQPQCASCHALFDPIGFAFEKYDATGKYRLMDDMGKAIDSNTELTSTMALDGTVKDAVDLTHKLSTADEVRSCIAKQWLRFGIGRDESPDDMPSFNSAMKGFQAGGFKVTDLVVALAKSDTFRYQKVKP